MLLFPSSYGIAVTLSSLVLSAWLRLRMSANAACLHFLFYGMKYCNFWISWPLRYPTVFQAAYQWSMSQNDEKSIGREIDKERERERERDIEINYSTLPDLAFTYQQWTIELFHHSRNNKHLRLAVILGGLCQRSGSWSNNEPVTRLINGVQKRSMHYLFPTSFFAFDYCLLINSRNENMYRNVTMSPSSLIDVLMNIAQRKVQTHKQVCTYGI